MRKREPASMPQAVSACMRSVRGPEATEPPLAGRSSCRLGRYAASAALSTKAISSRLRSTWTRVSSRPPRPPRARLLDSAGLVGDRTSSPLPRRPRSRNFSCWTCQNAATETSVSPQHQTTARRVREQCRMEGSAGAWVCGKVWPFCVLNAHSPGSVWRCNFWLPGAPPLPPCQQCGPAWLLKRAGKNQ